MEERSERESNCVYHLLLDSFPVTPINGSKTLLKAQNKMVAKPAPVLLGAGCNGGVRTESINMTIYNPVMQKVSG